MMNVQKWHKQQSDRAERAVRQRLDERGIQLKTRTGADSIEWYFHRHDSDTSQELLAEIDPAVSLECHVIESSWPEFRRQQILRRGELERRSPESPFYLGVVLEAMIQRFLQGEGG